MKLLAALGILLALATVARADMYQDGSNAKVPTTGTPTGAVCTTSGGALIGLADGCATPPAVVVPTLAALKALSVSTGKVAFRQGFTTPGDGGEALYHWAASSCSVADNGWQVASNTSGCWLAFIGRGAPSVKMWGAVCDGLTNDAVAINAAFAANPIGAIDVPNNCTNTATLNYPTIPMKIQGVAMQWATSTPTLKCRTGTLDCVSGANTVGSGIDNLVIDASGNTGGAAVSLSVAKDFLMSRTVLQNVFNGVLVADAGTNKVTFRDTRITGVNGAYGFTWTAATCCGDVVTLDNVTIACGYNATPANTADGFVWDGAVKTLNILGGTNILKCNHGLYVRNTPGGVQFPQFLVADNLQLEGATSSALKAESGSFFQITNSYAANIPSTEQGRADGPVIDLGCDAVHGVACGSAGAGASIDFYMTNTKTYSGTSECIKVDWLGVFLSNSRFENCSGASPTVPVALMGQYAGDVHFNGGSLEDANSTYSIVTTGGVNAGRVWLKEVGLGANTGPVLDVHGLIDGINEIQSFFIETNSSTTATGNWAFPFTSNAVPPNTVTCTQTGGNPGGPFYVVYDKFGLTVAQANSANQPYNCIAAGW